MKTILLLLFLVGSCLLQHSCRTQSTEEGNQLRKKLGYLFQSDIKNVTCFPIAGDMWECTDGKSITYKPIVDNTKPVNNTNTSIGSGLTIGLFIGLAIYLVVTSIEKLQLMRNTELVSEVPEDVTN